MGAPIFCAFSEGVHLFFAKVQNKMGVLKRKKIGVLKGVKWTILSNY